MRLEKRHANSQQPNEQTQNKFVCVLLYFLNKYIEKMWYDFNETTLHNRPNYTEINNYRSPCGLQQ